MPVPTVCIVCWSPIMVTDDYNDLEHKGVCSPTCASHEYLFCQSFSNEAIGEQNFKDFGIDTWELEKKKRWRSAQKR